MAIKLKLTGFDELLEKIEKAGGKADKAAEQCMKKSAETMDEALRSEMQKSNVPSELENAMQQPEVFRDGNVVVAKVGFKKGSYNPKNPSAAYKAIFLNYGTPHRTKHGKVAARGFIERAKKQANKTIKKQQEETLQEILARLQE